MISGFQQTLQQYDQYLHFLKVVGKNKHIAQIVAYWWFTLIHHGRNKKSRLNKQKQMQCIHVYTVWARLSIYLSIYTQTIYNLLNWILHLKSFMSILGRIVPHTKPPSYEGMRFTCNLRIPHPIHQVTGKATEFLHWMSLLLCDQQDEHDIVGIYNINMNIK